MYLNEGTLIPRLKAEEGELLVNVGVEGMLSPAWVCQTPSGKGSHLPGTEERAGDQGFQGAGIPGGRRARISGRREGIPGSSKTGIPGVGEQGLKGGENGCQEQGFQGA